MTSLSVRQYSVGIYEHLGLDETKITKVQTGGPDGDLGSSLLLSLSLLKRCNISCSDEILLSKDRTIAVIDGSGVLSDSEGIDREELIRLAKKRVPVSYFDTSKLSEQGYLVRIEDIDVTLPCECL
jgi:glutamate dehydrogenase